MGFGVVRVVEGIVLIDRLKSQTKVKKKNRKVVVGWLDQNVSTDCLNDEYFEVVDKIGRGEVLGRVERVNIFEREEDQDDGDRDEGHHDEDKVLLQKGVKMAEQENANEYKFRRTFGRL